MADQTEPEKAKVTTHPGLTPKKLDEDDKNWLTEKLDRMAPGMHRALAVWFILLAAVSLYGLVRQWPESPDRALRVHADSLDVAIRRIDLIQSTLTPDSALAAIRREMSALAGKGHMPGQPQRPSSDRILFELALFAGVLGGCAHGFSSLMEFRGQRRLFRSWTLWYFGLPLLGGIVAVIFFLVIRAGLFPGGATLDALSPFGVAAMGALTGLVTDKATTKLADVLDSLFLTGMPGRGGKLVTETEPKDEPGETSETK